MAKIKVCLDAGHYGNYNQSPAVKCYYESRMNWKLHLLLKTQLEKYGIEVLLTRSKQESDMDLVARGRASAGCDLFLSIHSNAVGDYVNEKVDYPRVYVQLDGKGTALGKKLAAVIEETMQTNQKGEAATRGSGKSEYYGVLRGAAAVGTMGMILEHSFHTNTRATNWLLQESNLQKLAEAEAKVIAEHFGVTMPEADNGVLYRVQIGAYTNKANADAQLEKAKAAGFKDAFIVAEVNNAAKDPAPAPVPEPVKKSIDEIAREVINGDWGNGEERKKRLTAAGYDHAAVQKRVNELLKG